ncbi:hypothetical protein [Pseudarthrobacter sp. J47]|uniref:hypothetical protein n=1 Tax=Pseudarthrobacter sp. J47 TaxID=3116482 RepID=UPI002E7FBDF3|nr:hypothetical protein [Pseudarthrobacter sp. J47]MEE2524525.1 hypothetical protein [Pseudarthrobacter sp. J47]
MDEDISERTPVVVQEADSIYESVRTICHNSQAHPAPTVYKVLGNLKGATGSMLAQALRQLAGGLERSLTEYDVYEDEAGTDPAASVAIASEHMRAAAKLATELGVHLEAAQIAIAQQGYRA